MNASIDLGNTFAKVGWFENSQIVKTQYKIPFDDLNSVLAVGVPQNVIISSTSQDTQHLANWLKDQGSNAIQLNSNTALPIEKDYETPQTLGADRLAAATGALFLFPNENCLVIDMGTCITYDWLSSDKVFHGGLISPGLRIRFEALHTFTKRLPLVQPDDFPVLIGKNTIDAMQSGVINGLLAELDGIVARYKKEKGKCKVVLCGGDAPFFESRLKHSIFAEPNLVLIGLNQILEYNLK